MRFPGAADADEFWNLLTEGRDAVSGCPGSVGRRRVLRPRSRALGKMVARRAGFLDDFAGFDASFFGLSAREAMFMDPQHRLMLETAWTAVEHAGIAPSALAGTQTGVFMGLSTHEFLGMLIAHTSLEDIDIYSGTGTSPAAAAGRISFRMGLQGPAVAVDTACSSSLVAVHQACQALDAGDCDVALVGGVNLILTPATDDQLLAGADAGPGRPVQDVRRRRGWLCPGRGLRGGGAQAHRDALRDGDPIRAVIRGSAVNQDGASGGLTVPNGVAQQQVIAEALRRAGVAPGEVDYLEAHGTGTSLGDPIEVQAAGAVFGEGEIREPAVADRLGEDEHRPPGGGFRHRRPDQGRACARKRGAAQASAFPATVAAHSLGSAAGAGGRRADTMAAQRQTACGRGKFVRILRNECACGRGGGARRRHRRRVRRAATAQVSPAAIIGACTRSPGAPDVPIPRLAGRES